MDSLLTLRGLAPPVLTAGVVYYLQNDTNLALMTGAAVIASLYISTML